MLIVGVDPGQMGALAVLYRDGLIVALHDLPIIRDGRLAWVDGGLLQTMLLDALRGAQGRAVVERVGAMPKQGIASAFGFGVGFGSILSVLQALHLPIELVTPFTWKSALGIGSDKRLALHRARLLFPSAELHLVKHDGRAEALLLAHWSLTRRAAA